MGFFRRDPEVSVQALVEATHEYLNAGSWDASLDVLERRPMLLGAQAEELLVQSVGVAESRGLVDEKARYEAHLAVLRWARNAGVAAVRAELPAVTAAGPASELDERFEAGHEAHKAYQATGDPQRLAAALADMRYAVGHARKTGVESVRFETGLGWGLMDSYAVSEDPADLDECLACFERALGLAGKGEPEGLVAVFGLASALAMREGPGDVDRSIHLLRQAIEAAPSDDPHQGALAMALSKSLVDRYAWSRAASDLDEGVAAAERALAAAADEGVRAGAEAVLAHARLKRFEEHGSRADAVSALRSLERNLAVHPPGSPMRAAAGSQIVVVLTKLAGITGDQHHLDRAIALGEELLRESPADGGRRRELQFRLGSALINRYAGTDADQLLRAADLLEASSAGRSGADLQRHVAVAVALLNRYYRGGGLENLERAHGALARVLKTLRSSFGALSIAEQLASDRENWAIYSLAADCMLLRGAADPEAAPAMRREAMTVKEAGKSRLLTERLGRGALPAPSKVPRALAERERELVESLVELDKAELASHQASAPPEGADPQQAAAIRRELSDVWKRIGATSPSAREWVELRRGEPPDWDDLRRAAAPGTALVTFAELRDGLTAFVLRHGDSEPAIVGSGLDAPAIEDSVKRMRREVAPGGRGRRQTWDAALVPFFREVGAKLGGIERVVLSPEGASHLLPWAVVAQRAGWASASGGPMPIATTPALRHVPRPGNGATGGRVRSVVVGDPRGDLAFARDEARAVASELGTSPLLGDDATADRVLDAMGSAAVVHLATHAEFDQASPLDSGIVLADRTVSAREIVAATLRPELVVLSACDTGVADSLGGNELAGLGQAFLHAGAPSVVMSLWLVDDEATGALMERFYRETRRGRDPAAALARAADAVRSDARWEHPALWGAFVLLTGSA